MTHICKRILGLDVGDKRIGIAVSDEMGITAQVVGTLVRSQTTVDCGRIMKIAQEKGAELIVAGLPKKLNGSSSPQTKKVEAFLAELRKHSHIPIETWDERLTTTSAEAILIEADLRRKLRRDIIDSIAAQIMLQHYLDCNPVGESERDRGRK
ncbi:MAG: Holliday junction resolvase RuvX [Candidatus Abyssobacteria bacterium SURF_17]|jgi:putative Holliday junction resolvase|uniref:Putative pre-16S rRNA nuclease n=1 Tax=Candidatus Abyssobacteria bacterium SURF_17 TaxID=2093361 RepID=A0A419EY31_9BACT|nr:MAG: Holliday junction resolvase RuvX [Candidatus Abyssubacteria bacterium SURF_17]